VTLDCDLEVSQGDFTLRAALTADPGEVVAVVGPNGAGKSTLLRALAGLTAATGRMRLGDADLQELPAHRRGVGWVPQDGALFPHLTAQDNVAFGLGGRRSRAEARHWLDVVGLPEHANRRPGRLSGGQAQKVALARALARQPRLLLLDEPMAALDATARTESRRTLRRHLASYDGVTLLVTHDPVDAATLATRVVALENGLVIQDAAPAEVARAPRSPWLATWMGVNAFRGRMSGGTVMLESGGQLTVAEPVARSETEVLAVVAAHAVTIHRSQPGGSARNTWPVVVRDFAASGSRVRVSCAGPPDVVAEVTPAAVADLGLGEGVSGWVSVKATEVTVVLL
jgi:ABC-type sulfate/molybdate transport systems ATPase subunit